MICRYFAGSEVRHSSIATRPNVSKSSASSRTKSPCRRLRVPTGFPPGLPLSPLRHAGISPRVRDGASVRSSLMSVAQGNGHHEAAAGNCPGFHHASRSSGGNAGIGAAVALMMAFNTTPL